MITYHQMYSVSFIWDQLISQEVFTNALCNMRFADSTFQIITTFTRGQWANIHQNSTYMSNVYGVFYTNNTNIPVNTFCTVLCQRSWYQHVSVRYYNIWTLTQKKILIRMTLLFHRSSVRSHTEKCFPETGHASASPVIDYWHVNAMINRA